MRSIPLLAIDDRVVFDEITAAKHLARRAELRAARANVLGAYQNYEDAVPEVGSLAKADLEVLQKEALSNAFSVETAPMAVLRRNLLKRIEVARCPFCGISESSTLDHYLPKESYPEFAVFPKNLIPCCAWCNTRKCDRILVRNTDVRMFLHPCYDTIPDDQFMTVNARIESNALILSFRLERPQGMATRTYRHLNSHFTELDLADRYRRMALEHLGGQHPAFRRAYGPNRNAARLKTKILEEAEDYESGFGPNYWLTSLYRSLAENIDFCNGGFDCVRL